MTKNDIYRLNHGLFAERVEQPFIIEVNEIFRPFFTRIELIVYVQGHDEVPVTLPLTFSVPADVQETTHQNFHNQLVDLVRMYHMTEYMIDKRTFEMQCEEHELPCESDWTPIIQRGTYIHVKILYESIL